MYANRDQSTLSLALFLTVEFGQVAEVGPESKVFVKDRLLVSQVEVQASSETMNKISATSRARLEEKICHKCNLVVFPSVAGLLDPMRV